MPAQIDNIHYTVDAVHAAKALDCRVFVGTESLSEYGISPAGVYRMPAG